MSRSNRNEMSANPTERYFQWSGSDGVMFEYNKDTKEKEPIGFPIRFAVLDILSSISGYSDAWGKGIWSNEVKQLDSENLWVMAGNVKIAEGYYQEIRDKVRSEGGKYAASVYAAVFTGKGDPILVNIKLQGSALNSWIDFQKGQNDYKASGRVKVYDSMIMLIGPSDQKKKGATKYYEPVFAIDDITEEEDAMAQKLDEEILQPFLKSRSQIKQQPQKEEEEEFTGTNNIYDPDAESAKEPVEIDDSDDLPF